MKVLVDNLEGHRLAKEVEEGNVEYKLKVMPKDEERLEKLASQMKYRLNEGGGEAIYELGVSDKGELVGLTIEEYEESLRHLEEVAKRVGATCSVVRKGEVRGRIVAEVLVRRTRESGLPVLVTIPVVGNVDSGKSTTISVLCSGELDDGNGLAMARIARYIHEIKMRRTSSISTHLLGFDEAGDVVNYELSSPLSEAEVFLASAKIISFVDLGGHERYLRTTLKGIMGHPPDYAMLIVGANAGVIGTTKEHLGVATSLKIPVFSVVTKADMVPRELLVRVLKDIEKLLKMPALNKIPVSVKNDDDVVVAARNMPSGRIVPIFIISNKTGQGLEQLRRFLNLLPPRIPWSEQWDKPFTMYVDDKFNVKGVGTVISGIPLQGSVAVDDHVLLGPFKDGSFRLVRVKSIQVNRVNVNRGFAGQEVCLAVTNVDYDEVDKGMCVLDKSLTSRAVKSFEARITLLYHPTTIKVGYNAVLHLQTIRQAVIFEKLSKEPLRAGDTATAMLSFLYKPEYVRPNDWFIFREGRTRGIGVVTRILE
ncbi:MAG: GTP-binding protein [Candidatus Nezhaarchaeales archaeon]